MTASLKIRQLESKISDLQAQHQLLLKERQQEIAILLTAVDLAHLDDKILVGGLLFLKEKISTQDSIMEAWHVAGEKFLRQHKPKSQHGDQLGKVRKKGNNCHQPSKGAGVRSQTSTQKNSTLKSNDPYQAANQSTQESAQPGEA